MGRIFEKRKHKMFARFDKMAKAFTRIGKDIAIAVKQGGPNPDNNPKLRMAIQNAKGVNMPKDRVENAIKRASSKEEKDYQEVVYEGYAPHGVPVLVVAATDNPTANVADIRLQGLMRLAQPFAGGAFARIARDARDGMQRALDGRAAGKAVATNG